MKEITVGAKIENIKVVINFINQGLDETGCPEKMRKQIDIAVDELFSNIAQYAYGENVGDAQICVGFENNPKSVVISFADKGIPYNPLEKDDPDVTLSVDDRPIGGLGIFLAKNIMDIISYEFKEGKNILTVKKSFRVNA